MNNSKDLAAVGCLFLAIPNGSDAGKVLDHPLGVHRLSCPGFSAGIKKKIGRWGTCNSRWPNYAMILTAEKYFANNFDHGNALKNILENV